jgi:hypothetical protein
MKKLKPDDFVWRITCIHDMNQKYVMIDGRFYYVAYSQDHSETHIKIYDQEKQTLTMIGYIYPKTKRAFRIKTRTNGFDFETVVRYSSVTYSQ